MPRKQLPIYCQRTWREEASVHPPLGPHEPCQFRASGLLRGRRTSTSTGVEALQVKLEFGKYVFESG